MLVKCLKEGRQKPMVGIFKRKYLIERIDHKGVGIAKRLKKILWSGNCVNRVISESGKGCAGNKT